MNTCPVCDNEVSYDHWSVSEHYCDDCATKLPKDGVVASVLDAVCDKLGVDSGLISRSGWSDLVNIVRRELVKGS